MHGLCASYMRVINVCHLRLCVLFISVGLLHHLCVWVYKRFSCIIYFNNKPMYRNDKENQIPILEVMHRHPSTLVLITLLVVLPSWLMGSLWFLVVLFMMHF